MASRANDPRHDSELWNPREVRTETAPGAYRKKPVVVQAAQWFKNGDHPDDNSTELFDYPSGSRVPKVIREGAVVRYFQRPDVPASKVCQHCGITMHEHGWIDTKEGGHIVCPGDWIITGVQGERYPCKPDIFAATYEPAAPVPSSETAPRAREMNAIAVKLAEKLAAHRDFDNCSDIDDRGSCDTCLTLAAAIKALSRTRMPNTDTPPIGSSEIAPRESSPWQIAERVAVEASWSSPCRSKRGVSIYRGARMIASACNYKPFNGCDGSPSCKSTCRREAIHAEQSAILSAGSDAIGSDLVHVKTVDGALVASGGPSCVECSKLIVAAGIAGVWLYHVNGWRRYEAAEFHRLSVEAARVPNTDTPPIGSSETAPRKDVVCEHGVAMDVHCCGCHSGLLLTKCVCF